MIELAMQGMRQQATAERRRASRAMDRTHRAAWRCALQDGTLRLAGPQGLAVALPAFRPVLMGPLDLAKLGGRGVASTPYVGADGTFVEVLTIVTPALGRRDYLACGRDRWGLPARFATRLHAVLRGQPTA